MRYEDRLDMVARMLAVRPSTRYEIAHELGLHEKYVSQMITDLRRQGRSHIVGYARPKYDNGVATSIHAAGPGEDAQRPPALTTREKHERYMSRMREHQPGKYAIRLAEQRLRFARLRGRPLGDELTRATFWRPNDVR